MVAEKNVYIGSAYRHLQVISQDEEKRMEYEAREKAIRDYNQGMFEAEQRGELRGRAEGRLEGERNGITRINKLNSILIAANRFDDLKRASEDVSYQSALMEELLVDGE